jgi:hypothetical protein
MLCDTVHDPKLQTTCYLLRIKCGKLALLRGRLKPESGGKALDVAETLDQMRLHGH